jgi:hypothetical protein
MMVRIMKTRSIHHPVMLFAVLGAASGGLSSIVTWVIWEQIRPESPFDIPDPTGLPHGYVPGLLFGLIIGIALVRLGRTTGTRAALFTLASTASYFAAYMAYFVLPDSGQQMGKLPDYPVAGLVSSALGGFLLAASAAVLFKFMRQVRPFVLVVVIGGVLGGLSDLLAPYVSDIGGGIVWKLGAVAFYAVWQGAVACAMATGLGTGATDATER